MPATEVFVVGPSITFATRVSGDTWRCAACPLTFEIPPVATGDGWFTHAAVRTARDHFISEHGTEADRDWARQEER